MTRADLLALAARVEAAQGAAQRLINGSFRRDGERLAQGDAPRFSIPARPDRDDDLVVTDTLTAAAAALRAMAEEAGE